MVCPPPHPDNCGAYDDDQHHGSQRNFPAIFYTAIIDDVRVSAIMGTCNIGLGMNEVARRE
jgi:hypothetical protein